VTATRKADWVDPRSTALIVVDVQQGFVNRHSRAALPAIVQLVKSWQAACAPVVMTRFHNELGSPYETITGWTRLRTADEQALIEELAPYTPTAAAVIDKSQSSLFTVDGARLIREAGWTDLVFCGLDTDACVLHSAMDAYQSGYRPWLVVDACTSTGGPAYHDAGLLLAGRNIGQGQLVTSDTILTRLHGSQGVRA
jgi:nicotinamidase-related amidase